MKKILDYFKSKNIGFYLTIAGVILFYAASIVYTVAFRSIVHPEINYSLTISLVSLVTVLVTGAMLVFDETERFAPAALGVGQFIVFLIFINDSYMYLSDYFFEISDFAGFINAIGEVDAGYIASFVLLLLVWAVDIVAIFIGIRKKPGENGAPKHATKITKTCINISRITTYVLVFVFGVAMVGGDIAFANESAINSQFNIQTQKRIESEDESENPDKYIYYKSAFTNFDDVLDNGKNIAREVMAEGATLLKNDHHTLPLGMGSSVSLFSASSVFPALSGTGSGAWIDSVSAGSTLWKDGFEEAGLSVNPELFNWYKSNTKYCRVQNGEGTKIEFTINDAKWDLLPSAKTSQNYKDAAIFILSRCGGEGKDLHRTTGDKADMTNGDYLRLSPSELDVLRHLKQEKDKGTFTSIILIINSAYQVWGLQDEDFGFDAVLWSGSIGSRGTYAIGDILTGKVNPSGRLSDIFWTKYSYNPASYNFGDFTYSDRKSTEGTVSKYVVYQENMYMGYRYAETRYEDKVLGTANVGDFAYYDAVEYPFGYGLSYTTFEYSNMQCVYNNSTDTYDLSVKVTNKGTKSGKEVVQIYLSKPYTTYDRTYHIEKPSVELVRYGKTDVIDPNGSQTLIFSIPRREFASYDAYNKKTYILEAGNYMLTVAKDSHEATNNILKAKGVTDEKILAKGNTGKGSTSMVKTLNIVNDDYKVYSKSLNGTKITNAFDTADIKIFEAGGVNENAFEWTTRSNWEGTVPTKGVALKRTTKMDQAYRESQGDNLESDLTQKDRPTYGADNGLQLIDLRAYADEDDDPTNDEWIPFDDPLWDQFLDQLTWDECVRLLSDGLRHTLGVERLGKPETLEHNGGVGFKNYTACQTGLRLASSTDLKNYRQRIINYPCNGTSASTFNYDLMYKMGVQWGEDALWTGHNVLYGPGNNLHRSAYNGRNFEYFSEDPVLTGFACRAIDEGMEVKGAVAYLKHCVLNDQETNRQNCVNTWCTEQAIRELYLKAFQIPIEEGPITGVMTAFNGLGPVWSSHQGFCKQVLHGEFGMKGVAVTDFIKDYMFLPTALLNGSDLPDGQRTETQINKYREGYSDIEWAMRDSLHYIMYQTVHTNVMNGTSANSVFVKLTPTWVSAIDVSRVIAGVLMGLSIGFIVTFVTLEYVKPGKKEE